MLVNKRILNVFKKKISILHTAFKQARKSGGNALKKVVNGWKFGPNYILKVFYNEVDVLKLKKKWLRSTDRWEIYSKSAWPSKQLNGFAWKRNWKLSWKRRRRKMTIIRDDLNAWQKTLQTCVRKKSQEAQQRKNLFSTTPDSIRHVLKKTIEGTMSHNPVIPSFIQLCCHKGWSLQWGHWSVRDF